MALITTPSAHDADSYVTIEEAKEYLAGNAAFMALEDGAIETLLKKATMQIDTMRFFGVKVDDEQALQFPRTVTDQNGEEYDQEEIIPKVKFATCEQAAHILAGEGAKRLQLQADGVTSVRIGDVSETLSGKNAGELSMSAVAKGYLKGFISRIGRVTNY